MSVTSTATIGAADAGATTNDDRLPSLMDDDAMHEFLTACKAREGAVEGARDVSANDLLPRRVCVMCLTKGCRGCIC